MKQFIDNEVVTLALYPLQKNKILKIARVMNYWFSIYLVTNVAVSSTVIVTTTHSRQNTTLIDTKKMRVLSYP